ncbi:MAG: RNA polymerase sigma factor [Chitinispirillaceae bacterium]|jgi:RNA polymerase sigma-70 factor (ECF subfamily)|nr:RNA polymerase sigma factor [Chitinispirillaceae bacterium]
MIDLDNITVGLATKGDSKAFRRLYDHYAPFVWRIAYRTIGHDKSMAEEIVQETFVRIHRSLRQFAANSTLGTWIYRITFNVANTILSARLRRKGTLVTLPDNLACGKFESNTWDTEDLLNKILNSLSPEERFLLVAREVDGLAYEEIADITGKSSESLRTKLSRLKEKIANSFGGTEQEFAGTLHQEAVS